MSWSGTVLYVRNIRVDRNRVNYRSDKKMSKKLNRVQAWMQRDTHMSWRKFLGIFTIAAIVLTIFNVTCIMGTGTGTTYPTYIQNGLLSTTNLNVTNQVYLGNVSLGFVSPPTFIIDQNGTLYRSWFGANQTLFWSNTNKTLVEQYAIGNTTSGIIYLKDLQLNRALTIPANVAVQEEYQGVVTTYDLNNVTYIPNSGISPGTYIINATGSNYQAWYGSTSTLAWSSTNSSAVIQNALGNTTVSGTVYVRNGTYNAVVSIPANVRLIVEGNNSGISYSAIGDGARIDSSEFYAGWGGYSTGSYTMATNGTNYCAFRPDDTIYSFGTNVSRTMNNALNNLTSARTWQEKAYMKGNFTQTNAYIVSGYTVLTLDGSNSLANGANCNMIQNAHPSTNDPNVIIEGGLWDGNGASQNAGNGIYWIESTNPSGVPWHNIFRNMMIRNCYQDDIFIGGNGQPYEVSNCALRSPQHGYGFNTSWLVDSEILNCLTIDGFYGNNIIFTKLANCYINSNSGQSAMTFDTLNFGNQVDNCLFDTAQTQPCITLKGTEHSKFSNLYVHIFGNAGANEAGIKLMHNDGGGYCTNNSFTTIEVGKDSHTGGTSQFGYAIEEESNVQDYNSYNGINGVECLSGVVYALGPHSTVSGSTPKVGYITNPVSGATLVDYAGAGAIANNTLYTCIGSAKNIFITAGAFDGTAGNVTLNGQVIFSNASTGPTMMIHIEPTMTIMFSWTSAPTIKVYGE